MLNTTGPENYWPYLEEIFRVEIKRTNSLLYEKQRSNMHVNNSDQVQIKHMVGSGFHIARQNACKIGL